ncbi:Vms1/Ankzf1 family peptidyl-tRNA hydrolase [Chloroflexota bacterium]
MEQTKLNKKGLLGFLDMLDSSQEHYLTVYLKPSSFPNLSEDQKTKLGPMSREITVAVADETIMLEAQRYQTGAVVFWNETESKYVILPPFAISEDRAFNGSPETSNLRQLLEMERTLGVLLVTWGSYAIGILHGDTFVESKVGTGHIHKRHKKGGSSQKRFARRTEKQKQDFLRRVSNRIEEKFKGHRPEYLFFGGNRLILKPLLQECIYLQPQADLISKRFINVRYANSASLIGSLEEINKCSLFRF